MIFFKSIIHVSMNVTAVGILNSAKILTHVRSIVRTAVSEGSTAVGRHFFNILKQPVYHIGMDRYKKYAYVCITVTSQITAVSIVCSTVCSGADQRTSKLRVTGLCEGNPMVTGGFPSQRASNAENVSIWWRHRKVEGFVHASFYWNKSLCNLTRSTYPHAPRM